MLVFIASVRLESISVLFYFGKGSEVRQRGNLDAVGRCSAGEIAQLTGIRCGDQDAPHSFAPFTGGDLKVNVLREKTATVRTNKIVAAEIMPPSVRSLVLTNLIST